MEEEEVADGDDLMLFDYKRRRQDEDALQLVRCFWRNTHTRHGSEALGWSIVFFYIFSALPENRKTETSSFELRNES